MVEALVNFFRNIIPGELTVFILSMMPIIELRGGLVAAKMLGVDLLPAMLICFAIPLPGTGAWTGSLAAALMKMPIKDALFSVIGGTLIADILMAIFSYGLLGMFI